MLNLITMTEYINSFLLLTLLGIIYCNYLVPNLLQMQNIFACYRNSDRFGNTQSIKQPGKDVDSELKVSKPRRGHKKKTYTKTLLTINEEDTNDIREKRETS